MKRTVRTPFFETSVKSYIYGQDVIDYAVEVDKSSRRYDVDAIFISPYTDIREIRRLCPSLIILAPYMDTLRPGRGIADVLPEAIKAAGADGVMLNHSERPMGLAQISRTIDRANELDLLTFACADTVPEAMAVAQLGPDILNPEPTELIGSGEASPIEYVRTVVDAVASVDPGILVEQAAGITTAQQIYDFILAGSAGAGSASGILTSENPYQLMDEMVSAVAEARSAITSSERES